MQRCVVTCNSYKKIVPSPRLFTIIAILFLSANSSKNSKKKNHNFDSSLVCSEGAKFRPNKTGINFMVFILGR